MIEDTKSQAKLTNYASEFELLREIEFSDKFELYLRMTIVFVSGILISIYMEWSIPVYWSGYFALSFAAYSGYILKRGDFVSRREVWIAAVFFSHMQLSYSSLPVLLLTEESQALVMVAACLIGGQLLFLVRRSNTLVPILVGQIVSILLISVIVYVNAMPHFDTPLAYIGVALALLGLNFYFVQSMRVSRRIVQSRERAAGQAHQAQKMAAIGQLAGGVAHDFNNNLTAIIGSLEMAQLDNDPCEQKVDLDNALIAARQASMTVKQLMIFARMDKPNISVVYLQDLFDELEGLTRRLIPTSVTFDAQVLEPFACIRADQHQLLAGLINLTVNSVDAMPNGGTLTLRATRVELAQVTPMADGSRLNPGDYIEISVMDTGHGIPSNLRSSVINPFFTTKPVGKGTGMGLSMVSGLMGDIGGGLSIDPTTNGTTIRLYAPCL